jgi:hypothetical protein
MKRSMILVIVLVLVGLTAGCSTSRFSLIDVDLRTPEQTKAYISEAEIVYEAPATVNTTMAKMGVAAVPVIVWEYVVELLKVTRGRIRVFSVEAKK